MRTALPRPSARRCLEGLVARGHRCWKASSPASDARSATASAARVGSAAGEGTGISNNREVAGSIDGHGWKARRERAAAPTPLDHAIRGLFERRRQRGKRQRRMSPHGGAVDDGVRDDVRVYFLAIGAADGVTGDPLYPHICEGRLTHGVVVEPLPDLFALLERNYAGFPDIHAVNCAVGDGDGDASMLRLPLAACAVLPAWIRGTSTLRPECSVIGTPNGRGLKPALRERIAPLLTRETVRVCRLSTLLADHQRTLPRVDVLQLDCEGMDWSILRQLDFTRLRPAVINLEVVHLPAAERAACEARLRQEGYKMCQHKYDLTCWL